MTQRLTERDAQLSQLSATSQQLQGQHQEALAAAAALQAQQSALTAQQSELQRQHEAALRETESHKTAHSTLSAQHSELQRQHAAVLKDSESRRAEQANAAQSLNAAHSHNSALSLQLASAQGQHAQAVQSLSALTSQHQHSQLVAEHANSNAELREADNKLGALKAEHAVLQVCLLCCMLLDPNLTTDQAALLHDASFQGSKFCVGSQPCLVKLHLLPAFSSTGCGSSHWEVDSDFLAPKHMSSTSMYLDWFELWPNKRLWQCAWLL